VDFEGSNFQHALLQGAKFNNARLSLSSFSASALWRASGARCEDAIVTDPDFGAFIATESVARPGGRSSDLVAIKPEPDAIDKFIEQSSRFVPKNAADQLRTRLKQQLSPRDPDTAAEQSQKDWSECAEKTDISVKLQENRVYLFTRLACEPTASSRYVAEGMTRLRWRLLDAGGARMLARRLLERDGKPCPGAKDLSDSVKAELAETAGE
jgi:pentapeptide repeat protein